MTNQEIREAVVELKELESMIEELTASANEIKDSIKTELHNREIETLDLGNIIIRNTTVYSNRFDTTNFKKVNAELYKMFLKQIVSHKFSIN